MKLKLAIGIFITAFLICSTPVFAQQTLRSEQLYATLDAQAKQGGSGAIQRTIEQRAGILNDRFIIMQWLKDRIGVHKDPDPFYLLYYSDLLFTTAQAYDKSGDLNAGNSMYPTSFLFLSIFEAVALTDAARCNDPSVIEPVRTLVAGRYAYFRDLKQRMPADFTQTSKKVALGHEERISNRPALAAICNSGMAAMKAAVENQDHSQKVEDAPGLVGGKKIVIKPKTPYVPNFLDDKAWNIERQKIRKGIEDRE